MTTFKPMLLAALFALATTSVCAAELSDAEGAELRARADRLLAQRAQNPAMQDGVPIDRSTGDVRLNRDRSDVKAQRQRAEVKRPKSHGAKAKGKERKKVRRSKRSLRDIPGALVRRR